VKLFLDVVYYGFVYFLIAILAIGGLIIKFSVEKYLTALRMRNGDKFYEGTADMFVGIAFIVISFFILKDRTGTAEWLQRLLPF